jgi:hypothetical protein
MIARRLGSSGMARTSPIQTSASDKPYKYRSTVLATATSSDVSERTLAVSTRQIDGGGT